jgi:hypothetical protein
MAPRENREKEVFTLLGDVVGSRETRNRRLLQRRLGEVLGRMNDMLAPAIPLETTIGDEFQAGFHDVATAIRTSLMVRLELLRTAGIDSRYGLGAGSVEVFSKHRPTTQDGPGWWTARDAIDCAKRLADTPHTSFARTYFLASPRSRLQQGEEAALNAFLFCRDAMVDRMKQPSRNRLCGLLLGWSQSQIAVEEGATQGAISQSLGRSGAFAIMAAQRALEEQYR